MVASWNEIRMKNIDKMSEREMRQELKQMRKIDTAIHDCLYKRKLCVRMSPDGTFKPEGEVKMTKPEFIAWVNRE